MLALPLLLYKHGIMRLCVHSGRILTWRPAAHTRSLTICLKEVPESPSLFDVTEISSKRLVLDSLPKTQVFMTGKQSPLPESRKQIDSNRYDGYNKTLKMVTGVCLSYLFLNNWCV